MIVSLQTARLVLRPPLEADLDAWSAMMADEPVARFIGGVQPRPTVWRGLMANAGCWSLRGYGMFSVVERSSGRWMGRVGPLFPEGWPDREIGWGLVRDAWGQGYATEAAAAAIDWTLDTQGWERFIHLIDPRNPASAKVAVRLGSAPLGSARLPEPYGQDEVELWGQSAAAWRARRSAGLSA